MKDLSKSTGILTEEEFNAQPVSTISSDDSCLPLVSVVVPSYNQEDLIYKTLQSLADQDYPNYEIIVIDDNSTDSTTKVVHDFFINSGCRGRLCVMSKNNGSARSRNKGIRDAYGEYIFFVDGDDLPEKNYISSLLNTVKNSNISYDAAFCGFTVHHTDIDKKITFQPGKINLLGIKPHEVAMLRVNNKINLSFWAGIYRRQYLLDKKIFFNTLSSSTCDVNFVIKTLLYADKISFTDESLYNYIIHPAMLSKKKLTKERKIIRYQGVAADAEDLYRSFSDFSDLESIKSLVRDHLEPQYHIKQLSCFAMTDNKRSFNEKLKDLATVKSLRHKVLNFNYNIEITCKSILLLSIPSAFYSYYKNRDRIFP